MTKILSETPKRIKSIMVIPNKELYNLSSKHQICKTDIGEGHKKTLIKYIYTCEISIHEEKINEANCSQDIACLLVEESFCVMLYNNMQEPATLTLYLPQTLTKGQKEDIKKALTKIGKCNYTVLQLSEDYKSLIPCMNACQNLDTLIDFINSIPEYKPKNLEQPKGLVLKPKKEANKQ